MSAIWAAIACPRRSPSSSTHAGGIAESDLKVEALWSPVELSQSAGDLEEQDAFFHKFSVLRDIRALGPRVP